MTTLVLCLNLLGQQYGTFATGRSGESLYFPSTLIPRSSALPIQPRLFRVGSAPAQLIEERQRVQEPPDPSQGLRFTNYYRVADVSVSADEQTLAITYGRECTGSNTLCRTASPFLSVIRAGRAEVLSEEGFVRLSANGRTALFFRGFYFQDVRLWSGSVMGPRIRIHSVQVSSEGRVVSDNGVAVLRSVGQLLLLRASGVEQLGLSGGPGTIDAAGESIAYATGCALRVYRIATREERDIQPPIPGCYSRPQVSEDGRNISFLGEMQTAGASAVMQKPQLFAMRSDGTDFQVLTADPDGVEQFVQSDDGNRIWYRSRGGQVLEVARATARATLRIPAIPSLRLRSNLVPGSLVRAAGTRLANRLDQASGFPLPRMLSGFRVLVDGVAVPVHSVTPTEAMFQVPWNAEPFAGGVGQVRFETWESASLPFEPIWQSEFEPRVFKVSPYLWPLGANASAFHGDWRGPVTQDDPARPGEYLVLIGGGLGPVKDPPPDGMPSLGLAPAIESLSCSAVNSAWRRIEVNVPYAGLIPGLVGLYQILILTPTVPVDTTFGGFSLSCGGTILVTIPYASR